MRRYKHIQAYSLCALPVCDCLLFALLDIMFIIRGVESLYCINVLFYCSLLFYAHCLLCVINALRGGGIKISGIEKDCLSVNADIDYISKVFKEVSNGHANKGIE